MHILRTSTTTHQLLITLISFSVHDSFTHQAPTNKFQLLSQLTSMSFLFLTHEKPKTVSFLTIIVKSRELWSWCYFDVWSWRSRKMGQEHELFHHWMAYLLQNYIWSTEC